MIEALWGIVRKVWSYLCAKFSQSLMNLLEMLLIHITGRPSGSGVLVYRRFVVKANGMEFSYESGTKKGVKG
jgi:hypothetical protein